MTLYRGSLLPDPRYDAVRAVFLAVMDDVEECPDGLYTARLLLFDDTGTAAKDAMDHVQAGVPEINTLPLLPPRTSKKQQHQTVHGIFCQNVHCSSGNVADLLPSHVMTCHSST